MVEHGADRFSFKKIYVRDAERDSLKTMEARKIWCLDYKEFFYLLFSILYCRARIDGFDWIFLDETSIRYTEYGVKGWAPVGS
jgi:hypothetical protein